MGEQTANLAALMETLLSRFDKEKVLTDKRAEAQTTFNTQVSHELQSLAKKIGLTQADVNDIRKVGTPSASSAPSSGSQVDDPSAAVLHTPAGWTAPPPPPPSIVRVAPPPSALSIPQSIIGSGPLARLSNDGPLLLSRPDDALRLPESGPQPVPREDYSSRPPRFEGDAPHVCLDHCLAYFELYRVPQHNWVATTALYVEGHAALWLRAFR